MRNIDEIIQIMELIPEDVQKRWCNFGYSCHCVGCVNGTGIRKLMQAGLPFSSHITEDEWKLWMEHKGYGEYILD